MKTRLTFTFICFGLLVAYSQEISKPTQELNRNSIYAEAFGQGFCWSLNYDRLLHPERSIKQSITGGIVYVPAKIGFGDDVYYGIPVSYNWLTGRKNHHLELGVGLTALLVNPGKSNTTAVYTYLSPKIGYRFQRPQGGIFFRATINSMIDLMSSEKFDFNGQKKRYHSTMSNAAGLGYAVFPWPGISLGYTFK